MDPKEQPINEPDPGCEECGAPCGPSGICKRCMAEIMHDLSDD